ncbi:Hint domain-containing protein [Myxosarcina sp. GI1(2024)]
MFFKILAITLSLCLLISFLNIEPAYSRGGGGGGCFSAGTLILTPEGDKPIEQLRSGDRVISYHFSTHHQERGTVGKIEIINSPDYYLIQYQRDWTTKNFSSMTDYINEYFYTKQKEIFKSNFGNNFDIIYDCRLSQIIPIDIELEEYQCFFRVQINGEMINFKLSPTGYIFSGKPYHRSFGEYWDVKLTLTQKYYLVNISQVI